MIAIVDYCSANVPASLKGINMASFGLLTCRSVAEINHWGALKCHSISVRTKHVNLQLQASVATKQDQEINLKAAIDRLPPLPYAITFDLYT